MEQCCDKENQLIRTIRVPNRYNFGQDLKARLPKSKYDNASEVMVRKERVERNGSVVSLGRHGSEERLPEVVQRRSSRERQNVSIPRPRLAHLR